MIDMVQKVLDKKAEKIKRMPCMSNRASSLGYAVPEIGGCLRRGVYERTHWQEKEMIGPETQLIFDEGNRQEVAVLQDLSEAGVQIIEQQTAFAWEKYNITGHIDGVYIDDFKSIPVEIKSMHPGIYDQITSFEDFKKHPWTRAYMAQIMLYMLFKNIDVGIFILKNKSNGQLRQVNVALDYDLAEACIKTAEQINVCIADGIMPDKITDRETCKKCPFKLLCLPDIDFGAELKIVDDPDFEKRVDRYFEIEPVGREYKSLHDLIADRIKSTACGEPINQMTGKYRITGEKKGNGYRWNIDKI